MFEGYWNRPDATAAVIKALWLHTGDIGRFDEQDGAAMARRRIGRSEPTRRRAKSLHNAICGSCKG
jgi:acyl-CoA synthetase (AMP-forming)/AMP-acid ligase II